MIYLASQSPQRAFLLAKAGIDYEIVPIPDNEASVNAATPQATALERACAKADSIDLQALPHTWNDGDCILSADTVTSLGAELFGKPDDHDDAVRILSALQGTTHTVTTAHCCLVPAKDGSDPVRALSVSMAQVTMRAMSTEEIEAYVQTGESAGRSGAYALQAKGDRYVVDLQGSYDTVIGLHVATVVRLYRECTGRELLPEGREA